PELRRGQDLGELAGAREPRLHRRAREALRLAVRRDRHRYARPGRRLPRLSIHRRSGPDACEPPAHARLGARGRAARRRRDRAELHESGRRATRLRHRAARARARRRADPADRVRRRRGDGALSGRLQTGSRRRRARRERVPFRVDPHPEPETLSARGRDPRAAARGRRAEKRRGEPTMSETKGIAFLAELERIIDARLESASPEQSYTAKLARKGAVKVAQKVGEEGVELALAAAAEDGERVQSEAADLLYHLLLLLRVKGLRLEDAVAELERRHAEAARR